MLWLVLLVQVGVGLLIYRDLVSLRVEERRNTPPPRIDLDTEKLPVVFPVVRSGQFARMYTLKQKEKHRANR